MSHSHQMSVRCSHKIDFLMYLFQFFFQNDHTEHTGSGGYVTGTDRYAVCSRHSRARIPLRRTERNTCFQLSRRIDKLCPRLCQLSCVVSRCQYLGHNVSQFPVKSTGSSFFIELPDHSFIEISCFNIDREHTGSLSHTKHLLSRELPVDITCQCRKECHVFYMRFLIQNCLIEMGNAPSLGNMIREKLCQFVRSLFCDRISPGTERHQKRIVFVKCHIAVHHGAESHGSQTFDSYTILGFYIFHKASVTILQPHMNLIQAVCPDTIHIIVFPVMASRCDRGVIFSYQHRFDTGRAKFNTQHSLSTFDKAFYFFLIHTHVITSQPSSSKF